MFFRIAMPCASRSYNGTVVIKTFKQKEKAYGKLTQCLNKLVKKNEQWEQWLSSDNLPFCRPNIVGKRKDHFKFNLIKDNWWHKEQNIKLLSLLQEFLAFWMMNATLNFPSDGRKYKFRLYKNSTIVMALVNVYIGSHTSFHSNNHNHPVR